MGACVSTTSEESELAKQVLGATKADPKTVRRLSALGAADGEAWVTRQTSDIRKVFRFVAQLGKGQFGTIHIVTDTAGDRFACKQISKRKLAGTTSLRDIRREIEIMHHLRGHPNVINLHGAYEDANDVYLVMELCTGGDLFERIEKITTITERSAASLFRELAETVSYCHTLGVVHRDLKPENFLITDRGSNSRIKLADFGLSCFLQEGGGDGAALSDMVGSAYYMAPEVVRRRYGVSCDTWSLGVILHILLAGGPPFTGSSDADILRAVQTQEVDLTASPWPSISRHARHLVGKMLEKDPDKRIRLDQVLSHPWLRPDGTAPPRALQGGLRERISRFRALNAFQREARRAVAAALPPEEVSGMKLLFEAMDTDHDGLLSLEELRAGLARRGEELQDADVRALLQAADLNCDGFLDYKEFVAATATLGRMQRSAVLLRAFRHFDLDGDGFISRQELAAVLAAMPPPPMSLSPPPSSESLSAAPLDPALSASLGGGRASPAVVAVRESVSQLLAEADLDSDGRVDFREFCAMVLSGPEGGRGGGGGGGGGGDGGGEALSERQPALKEGGGGCEGAAVGVGQQLVQPANLPGLVDEAASSRGVGGVGGGTSLKHRDLGGGDGGSDRSGGGDDARRALSIIGGTSRGGCSTRGGGSGRGAGDVSGVGEAPRAFSIVGGGSPRPSQPGPALVVASSLAAAVAVGRGSGSRRPSQPGPVFLEASLVPPASASAALQARSS